MAFRDTLMGLSIKAEMLQTNMPVKYRMKQTTGNSCILLYCNKIYLWFCHNNKRELKYIFPQSTFKVVKLFKHFKPTSTIEQNHSLSYFDFRIGLFVKSITNIQVRYQEGRPIQ